MSPTPGAKSPCMWLVTLSVRQWPPRLPCWELQAAVINDNPTWAPCARVQEITLALGGARGMLPGGPPLAAESALRYHTGPTPWQTFPARALAPTPAGANATALEPASLEMTVCLERAPGSAVVFGVEGCAAVHFSPRMPNPLSPLHLDFIFSPLEIARRAVGCQHNSRCPCPAGSFNFQQI